MYIYQHVTVYFVCFFFLISQSIQKDKKKEIALIYNKFLEQNKLLWAITNTKAKVLLNNAVRKPH